MTHNNEVSGDYAAREVTVTRIIRAPRELVYEVWTDPHHAAHWWGPKGFTNTIHSMDVRAGGIVSYIMHGPDGTDYPNKINYLEVVKPERLVYIISSGIDNDPEQFQATVTFEDQGSDTRLIIKMLFNSPELRDLIVEKYGAVEGANETLDKLENYLVSS